MSLGVVRVGQRQLLERLRLGGAQEGEELRHVERVGAVVVLGAAGGVAGAAVGRRWLGDLVRGGGETVRAGHVPHDQRFQALFAGVGGHGQTSISCYGEPRSQSRDEFFWRYVGLAQNAGERAYLDFTVHGHDTAF